MPIDFFLILHIAWILRPKWIIDYVVRKYMHINFDTNGEVSPVGKEEYLIL